MAIVQCVKRHYYDDSRDSSCPYCKKLKEDEKNNNINITEEQLTVFNGSPDFDSDDNFIPTEAYGENTNSEEKTLGIYSFKEQNLLTAGWLVCIDGFVKGQSFPLYAGYNFVGRSEEMDIVIREDKRVVREKHFSVAYDPKSISFYIVEGNGRAYINGSPAIGKKKLKEYDVIEAGESKFCFVPFCKDGQVWE